MRTCARAKHTADGKEGEGNNRVWERDGLNLFIPHGGRERALETSSTCIVVLLLILSWKSVGAGRQIRVSQAHRRPATFFFLFLKWPRRESSLSLSLVARELCAG